MKEKCEIDDDEGAFREWDELTGRVVNFKFPKTWPEWERIAINHVDQALHRKDAFRLPLDRKTTGIFFAGMLGYGKYRRYNPDAFDAGRLARIVFDERSTFVIRVWEFVASKRGRWVTEDEIARGFELYGPGVRDYLRHLVRSGELQVVETHGSGLANRVFHYRRKVK